MTAAIVGWAHTPFGKLTGETVESLIVRVTNEALADAGIEAKDVDEIVLGHFNAGFSPQDFTASLVLQASPDLRFKRALRVENACATGSAAVHQGIKSIAAKAARIVLAVGVEQMTTTPAAEIGRNLLKASYVREEAEIDGGFAGVFGQIAGLYFQKYGDQSDALAMIAAKNHKNGVGNPYAQMRKDLGYDFCRTESEKNPFVAGPLKRTDCSLVSDGAAAVVLTRQSIADAKGAKPVARLVAHAAHAQEPKDFTIAPVGAINKLLAKAGWTIGDVDLFEVNEAFACVAMFAMHDLGIPHDKINVHGGATALGHPIGASGTRIITTLIAALQRHGKTRGIASLCIGGGEATAVAIELV